MATARKPRCSALAGNDKKTCTATLKAEQAELKAFLAGDLVAAFATCQGAGFTSCVTFCN